MTETANDKYPLVEKPANDFIEEAETIIERYREEDAIQCGEVEQAAADYAIARKKYEEAKFSYEQSIKPKAVNKYAAMLEDAAARHAANANHPEDIKDVCRWIIEPKNLFGNVSPKAKLYDLQMAAEGRIAAEEYEKKNAHHRARHYSRPGAIH